MSIGVDVSVRIDISVRASIRVSTRIGMLVDVRACLGWIQIGSGRTYHFKRPIHHVMHHALDLFSLQGIVAVV
jgi:hypothetical protein